MEDDEDIHGTKYPFPWYVQEMLPYFKGDNLDFKIARVREAALVAYDKKVFAQNEPASKYAAGSSL
jgi:hypothetical protein